MCRGRNVRGGQMSAFGTAAAMSEGSFEADKSSLCSLVFRDTVQILCSQREQRPPLGEKYRLIHEVHKSLSF